MENLENRIQNEESRLVEKPSFGDYTRKSVVGAIYRVGASFTMDAIYLTAVGALSYYLTKETGFEDSVLTSASDFVRNLDPSKLARVTGAVIAINFVDYELDVTNRLDKITKNIQDRIARKVKKKG